MFDKKGAPLLTESERMSPAWQKIKKYLDAHLATLREQNDRPDLSPERSAFIRGRIRETKELASLDTKVPTTQQAADDPFKD